MDVYVERYRDRYVEREMYGCVCGERDRDRYVERDMDRYAEREIGIGMWREMYG